MLRRAKSVDIPFMVKGYQIGLRDGNFSESKMQINAFFANTTTHKNVHSYIYEQNGIVTGYSILRKKDDGRHEIMMMFVDPDQQGKGIGKQFLSAILSGPMKDSPIVCSTTQPASKQMMRLLKGLGFERKIEASDGVYWEKRAGSPAAIPPPAKPMAAPTMSAPPPPRLTFSIPLLAPETSPDSDALEAATTVTPIPFSSYTAPSAATPVVPPAPSVIEGASEVISATLETDSPSPPTPENIPPAAPSSNQEEVENTTPKNLSESDAAPPSPSDDNKIVIKLEISTSSSPVTTTATEEIKAEQTQLPLLPTDFSGRASGLGYDSKREQARQLARELFATLKTPEPVPITEPPLAVQQSMTNEEDIPLLATLNVVREKMGSLPGVSLPPLDRYSLMEFNRKDLENMNVVELAVFSAQLIKLAKDQLAEIDRLKSKSKSKRS